MRPVTLALGFGVVALLFVAAPSACIYPDFTFDEPEPSGSSSSSSGAPGVEDCQNNKDDDGDGAVDCADTDCGGAGFACVPGIPLGWEGYQSLYFGAFGDAPSSCPSQFPTAIPYVGTNMLTADPAACTACTCQAPADEVCNLPDVISVIEKNCVNAAMSTMPTDLSVPAAWDGSCEATGSAPGGQFCGGSSCNLAVKSAAPTLTAGTCTPGGGVATKPDLVWGIKGVACGDAPQGGGCEAGQACQPAPSAPFLPGLCIYKAGENDCPGAPFTEQHILYEGVDDTRDCAMCTCGGSQGGSCSANITVYSDPACSSSLATFQAGACAALSMNPGVVGRKADNILITPGSCPAAGGEATGGATPSKPTTFCCIAK